MIKLAKAMPSQAELDIVVIGVSLRISATPCWT